MRRNIRNRGYSPSAQVVLVAVAHRGASTSVCTRRSATVGHDGARTHGRTTFTKLHTKTVPFKKRLEVISHYLARESDEAYDHAGFSGISSCRLILKFDEGEDVDRRRWKS